MKLSKDQIKKISLSLVALVALVYCYFTFLLGPLQTNQANMIRTTAELEGKMAVGKKAMQQISLVEKSSATALAKSDQINAMMPEGAPIAWFPPRLKSFFATDGLENGGVRLLNVVPMKQPEMPGFVTNEWSVDFAHADFLALGKSIARFENENPIWSIVSVRIHADPSEPAFQTVALGVTTILRK